MNPLPLIGREHEMSDLLAGLDGIATGRGRLFLVGGQPGVGKSRLVDELTAHAQQRGNRVLWGRCWEAGGAPPYWPWVQALRSHLRNQSGDELREVLGSEAPHFAQLVPEIRQQLPDLPEPLQLDPDSARFRLFDSVTIFLSRISRPRPLVLVLEDLHAADEPSLLLLRFVSSELSSIPVLLVATFRDTDAVGEPLATLGELKRQPETKELSLRGLAEPDLRRLVELTTGVVPPAGLAHFLHTETEGNPLFVGEIVQLLHEEGRLDRPVDTFSWRSAIPPGLREVILKRLSRLSQGSQSMLTLASILGREFAISILARIADLSREAALESLDEAVSARLVIETPAVLGRLRFSHVLVRDALYGELNATERIRLHERAGRILEEEYAADLESHVTELAHHFFEAAPGGDVERALDYGRRAAVGAAEMLAYEESIRLYAMTLQVVDLRSTTDERLRCELLLGMGDAQARAGDARSAKETFIRAAGFARGTNSADQLARAALGYGGRFVWEAARGDPHLRELLEEALDALGEEDTELRVRVMARLAGGPLRDLPERETRAELSRKAVEMARRVGDPATLAYALDGRYAAVWWPENLEERVKIAAELIAGARQARDKERELQGHHYLCLALMERGDITATMRELQAQVSLAQELRQPSHFFYVTTVRAMLATFEGRYEEAKDLIPKAFDQGVHAERSMAEIYRALQLYALLNDLGRVAEAEQSLTTAIDAFPTYYALRCALADVYAQLGREREARAIFEALAANGFENLARNDEWLFAMSVLSEVASRLGDAERAATLYDLLSPYSSRVAVSPPDVCLGSVALLLGKMATLLGRLDAAERHCEHAVQLNSRMGGRPWVARSEQAYARMLLKRSGPGDKERAEALVLDASQICKELRMSGLDSELSQLATEMDIRPVDIRLSKTFMFTDIVKSTDLVQAIGDDAWTDLVRWHDQELRSLFAAHRGQEVDHAGDGFFVAFDDASSAIECAVAIQRRLRDHRREHGFAPQVRIGLHRAEAVRSGSGYRGKGVHEAARIAALAQGAEIVASQETLLNSASRFPVSEPRNVTLKGVSRPVHISTLGWN